MVLRDLDHYVVKPTGASGGYGVVIGPKASDRELAETRERIEHDPGAFIAQPVIQLSVHPTICRSGIPTALRRWRRAISISGRLFCSARVRGCCRAV